MNKINLKLCVKPLNDKTFDLSLESNKTGEQVVKKFLDSFGGKLPKLDEQGNPYSYKLTSEFNKKEISKQTLEDAGVKEGDTLILYQVAIAG